MPQSGPHHPVLKGHALSTNPRTLQALATDTGSIFQDTDTDNQTNLTEVERTETGLHEILSSPKHLRRYFPKTILHREASGARASPPPQALQWHPAVN